MLEKKSSQKVSRFGTEIKDPKNIKDFLKLLDAFTTNDVFNKKDLLNWFGEVYKTGLVTPNTKKAPLSMEKIKKDANRRFRYLIQNLVVEETQTVGEYKITDSGRKILLGDPRGYFEIAQRRPILRMAVEILIELQKLYPTGAYLTKKDLALVEASLPLYKCKELLPDIILLHKSQNPCKDFKKILSKPNPALYPMQTDSRSGCEIENISDYGDTSFRMLRLTGVIKEENEVLVLNPDSKTEIEDFLQQKIEIVTNTEKAIKDKKIFKPASNFSTINSVDGKEYYIKKTGKRLGTVSKKNNREAIEATKIKNGDISEELFCIQERAAGKIPTRTSKDFEGKEDVLSSDLKYEIKSIVGPLSTLEITNSEFARLLNGSLDALVIYFNDFSNRLLIPAKELIEMCNTGKIKVIYTDIELAFTEACEDYIIKNTEDVPSVYIEQAKEICNEL